jgi:hypothetical protein
MPTTSSARLRQAVTDSRPPNQRDDCHELLPFCGDLWFPRRRFPSSSAMIEPDHGLP